MQLFYSGMRDEYPPFPANYLGLRARSVLQEYHWKSEQAMTDHLDMPEFPEKLLLSGLHNTWHDTAESVVGNWIGLVYQLTGTDRHQIFMDGVDPDDPLGMVFPD